MRIFLLISLGINALLIIAAYMLLIKASESDRRVNCKETSDLINRSDAIEQIQAWAVNLGNPKMLSREDTIYILKTMPSAINVKRKSQ